MLPCATWPEWRGAVLTAMQPLGSAEGTPADQADGLMRGLPVKSRLPIGIPFHLRMS